MRLSFKMLEKAFLKAWPPEKYGRFKPKSKSKSLKIISETRKKLGGGYVFSDINGISDLGVKVNFYSERARETRSFILDQNLQVVEVVEPLSAGPKAKWGVGEGRDPEIYGDAPDPIEAASSDD